MKKIFLILLLVTSFFAHAQTEPPTSTYTKISTTGYNWLRGYFRALNLPVGDEPVLQTNQWTASGGVFLDTVDGNGHDAGLYLYRSGTWVLAGSDIYTASQGITLTGNDFRLGGSMDTNRVISWKNIYTPSSQENAALEFGRTLSRGLFNLTFVDTMPNPDTERMWGIQAHTFFRSPSYTSSIYRWGHNFQVTYQNADSVKLNSYGGDFGGAVRSNFHFKRLSGFTGRSVYVIGAQTLNDIIAIHLANLDWGDETSTTSNYKYVKGYIGGHQSYLVTRANDTLTNWVAFNSMGFAPGGYVSWAADYVGGYWGNVSSTFIGKHWYLYNRGANSPSWLQSAMYIGDSTLTSSALLNVSSTSKGVVFPRMTGSQQNAISSPTTGLLIYNTDSLAYCFYNGTAWLKLNTGTGGSTPTAINDIGDATGSGLINVGNNSQQWDFTGLTGSGLLIQSNSTAAISGLHKPFRVITTGANASSSVISTGVEISNTHTGTSSTNVGLNLSAINGTNNYALIIGANNGQVGVGTDTPNPSARVDITSTTQGFLAPRMNTTQQDAIGSPATGLLIYNTDSSLYRFYNGSTWASITTGSGGGGDALTSNPLSQFASTTSAQFAGVISDETGTGAVVLGTSPDFTTGITIGSVAVPTISSTNTLTNKRWTARVGTTTSSSTPTINTDDVDIYKLTAQTADITSFTTNLSGSPVDGDVLEIQITGTASRALTWGASFVGSTIALPTTTTGTATLTVIFQYFTTSSYGNNKWICVNSF